MARILMVNFVEALPVRRHRRHVVRDVGLVLLLVLGAVAFLQAIR